MGDIRDAQRAEAVTEARKQARTNCTHCGGSGREPEPDKPDDYEDGAMYADASGDYFQFCVTVSALAGWAMPGLATRFDFSIPERPLTKLVPDKARLPYEPAHRHDFVEPPPVCRDESLPGLKVCKVCGASWWPGKEKPRRQGYQYGGYTA